MLGLAGASVVLAALVAQPTLLADVNSSPPRMVQLMAAQRVGAEHYLATFESGPSSFEGHLFLWRTDGTEQGTRFVAELNAGPNFLGQRVQMMPFGDRVLITVGRSLSQPEVIISDGTARGTYGIADLDRGGDELFYPSDSVATPLWEVDDRAHVADRRGRIYAMSGDAGDAESLGFGLGLEPRSGIALPAGNVAVIGEQFSAARLVSVFLDEVTVLGTEVTETVTRNGALWFVGRSPNQGTAPGLFRTDGVGRTRSGRTLSGRDLSAQSTRSGTTSATLSSSSMVRVAQDSSSCSEWRMTRSCASTAREPAAFSPAATSIPRTHFSTSRPSSVSSRPTTRFWS